jgi:two-component system chemotaxis sensor kinase CheA
MKAMIVSFLVGFFFHITFYFTKRKKIKFIRYLIPTVANTGLGVALFLHGQPSGISILFILAFNFVAMILVTEAWWVSALYLGILFIVYTAGELNAFHLFDGVIPIDPAIQEQFSLALKLVTIFFIMVVSYYNILMLKRSHIEKEEANLQLENKKNDINVMLQNLNQAVCIIEPDGHIYKEYSKKIEEIFETQNIAGRLFIDFLSEKMQVSSDQKAMIKSNIDLGLGNHLINFASNLHNLPKSLISLNTQTQKYLELDWIPITDADETVNKILVSMKDVTELIEVRKKKETIEKHQTIIQEIIASNISRFEDNYADIKEQFDRCQMVLDSKSLLFREDIIAIRRYLHTIKGQARFACWQSLADLTNDSEVTLDKMNFRQNKEIESTQFSIAEVLPVFEKMKSYIMSYQTIFLEKIKNVEQDKSYLKKLTQDMVEIRKIGLKSVLPFSEKILRLIYTASFYNPLEEILLSYIPELKSIAKQLGKETPQFHFLGDKWLIAKERQTLMKRVFGHFLNNSIDHGLETAEERNRSGRSPWGTITFETRINSDSAILRYYDDGKGLNLLKIKKKGMKLGLLTEKSSDQEIAEIIFNNGFSTKDSLSEISGHGVGLDTVQHFLLENQCQIKIELLKASSVEDHRTFCFVVVLPLSFVAHETTSDSIAQILA